MRNGYSLLEVILSTFLLTGMVLAFYSVLSGSHRTVSLVNHQIEACSLASKICEELHTLSRSEITARSDIRFPFPFNRYLYSIQVEPPAFAPPMNQALQQVTVTVMGPVDASGQKTLTAAVTNFTLLLARQPNPRP